MLETDDTEMDGPTVLTRIVHGTEREITIEEDGTHHGVCVVSYNEDRDVWSVLCPYGHYHTEINDMTGLYGKRYWKGQNVECEGKVADRHVPSAEAGAE